MRECEKAEEGKEGEGGRRTLSGKVLLRASEVNIDVVLSDLGLASKERDLRVLKTVSDVARHGTGKGEEGGEDEGRRVEPE